VISRRELLLGSLSSMTMTLLASRADADEQGLAALERRYGGRLGVAILDTARPPQYLMIAYRDDERFPLCSTFKCLAAALVSTRVDRGKDSLDRRIIYQRADLVAHSPATEKHLADGMTIREICAAALTQSDNTAGNLMLDSFGGPAQLTAYARSLGDSVTRSDRRETELNNVGVGDPRDTTTPAAMLENLRKLVLGDALSNSSREQLISWLIANKTGDKRLRAGVPQGWRVGDKTGTGDHGETNDIAVIWPPGRAPIIVTAYYAGSNASDDERNAVIAKIGRLAAMS
jgi:beta-lactamase class A